MELLAAFNDNLYNGCEVVLGMTSIYYIKGEKPNKKLRALFQLKDPDGVVLVESSNWNEFLTLVEEELGKKFFRENGLYEFFSTEEL